MKKVRLIKVINKMLKEYHAIYNDMIKKEKEINDGKNYDGETSFSIKVLTSKYFVLGEIHSLGHLKMLINKNETLDYLLKGKEEKDEIL